MTDIEQIKREVHEELGYPEHPISRVIDYLHSRGYLGGVPDGYVLVPKEAVDIILNCIELNMSNYDEDQVCELNDAVIECAALISAAPRSELLCSQSKELCSPKGETK